MASQIENQVEDFLADVLGPNESVVQAAVEMVVSGRSFPGTEISIAGQGIPTGPDGAFSLRVSVPEVLIAQVQPGSPR